MITLYLQESCYFGPNGAIAASECRGRLKAGKSKAKGHQHRNGQKGQCSQLKLFFAPKNEFFIPWSHWNFYSFNSKFESLAIFLPLWFYVKWILADFRRSKSTLLTIFEAFNHDFLEFHTWKCQNISNNQEFRAANIFKIAIYVPLKLAKINFT